MLTRDLDRTAKVLADWLGDQMPTAADVAVTDLALPQAGASNETILFTASWVEHDQPNLAQLVLRVQPDATSCSSTETCSSSGT